MTDTPPSRPRLPTPTRSPSPTSPVIDYSPHTVPYDETFENDLMTAILHAPEQPAAPAPSATTSPPLISASALPIPLSSPLRTHPSPIPGVRLTHERGHHTGGPGPSGQAARDFAARFIAEAGVAAGDAAALERAVARAQAARLEDVRNRMRAREEAWRRNLATERELGDLKLQRQAEVRVLERMKGKR